MWESIKNDCSKWYIISVWLCSGFGWSWGRFEYESQCEPKKEEQFALPSVNCHTWKIFAWSGCFLCKYVLSSLPLNDGT